MKENIIGSISNEEEITIKVSTLIDLLTVPVALRMQAIRHYEEKGYSPKDIFPNRETLSQLIHCALTSGFVHDSLTTELGLKGIGKNQLGWARDYLILLQQSLSTDLPSSDI